MSGRPGIKVFAYPRDGINGILAAWGRADNFPRFVQARHEEMAAFDGAGYAKFTGRFGVCMATSGSWPAPSRPLPGGQPGDPGRASRTSRKTVRLRRCLVRASR